VFAWQDWIIKEISDLYPVHEAIIIRCIVALPIMLILVRWQGSLRDLVSPRLRWLALRGLILVVSYTTYYLAFPAMPLAQVIALWFTTPLFVVALAGPLLGETVGPKRWAAAILGFVGVLIMMRPFTAAFDLAALMPVASALTYGTAQLMARRMGVTESAAVMSFYQNLMFFFAAGIVALLVGDGRYAGSSDVSQNIRPQWRGFPCLNDPGHGSKRPTNVGLGCDANDWSQRRQSSCLQDLSAG